MADVGPPWLLWANQMKTHHSDLVKQVQQNAEATTRNTEDHSDLVRQVQQTSEAVAQQVTVSHSALVDEAKTIRGDLQLLSSKLGEVEKHCDAEVRNTNRRVASLEKQSGTLLGVVEGCKSQTETALQRQRQETPEWRMQQAHDLTELKEYQRRENIDRKTEIDDLRAQFEKLTDAMKSQDVPRTFVTSAVPARSNHHSQAATHWLPASQITESSDEHHSHGVIQPGDLSKSPEDGSQATPFKPTSAGAAPSQGPNHGTHASHIDGTTNFEPNAVPVSPPCERHTQQPDDLITQDFYDLDEYLVLNGDAICSKLRQYEKNLIKQFINNMKNADQKDTLVESLNREGWTWKSAEKATNMICLAEREKREADEEARRIAAEETAREARLPRPKANTQRRKRKKKNW